MTNSNDNQLNKRLVQKLYHDKRFTDEAIGRAFLNTPRHLFVPNTPLDRVYKDQVIPTKFAGNRPISSSSQPAMMAIMLQQLQVKSGMNLLEIGAGTGFNAGLLSQLVGRSGRVTTIDIDQDIVENAQAHLDAAGVTNVTVIQADGINGYAPHAPYDRIILTVSAADIAPAWVDQLKENGRLLLPLALNGPQKSIAFKKEKRDGRLHTLSIENCGFMPLRGTMANQKEQIFKLAESDNGELSLLTHSPERFDVATLKEWFTQKPIVAPIPLTMSRLEGWSSFNLWLALHDPHVSTLYASGEWYHNPHIPALYRFSQRPPHHTLAPGLATTTGLALLTTLGEDDTEQMQLAISSYGERSLALTLTDHLQAWHTAGRPQTSQLKITAHPRHLPLHSPQEGLLINNPFTQLHIQWQN